MLILTNSLFTFYVSGTIIIITKIDYYFIASNFICQRIEMWSFVCVNCLQAKLILIELNYYSGWGDDG